MGKNFKDTLLIPKTDFPMRGNLGKKEPVMQESWREDDLYNKVLDKNKDPVLLPNGSEKKSPKMQFKEFMGLTLSFKF